MGHCVPVSDVNHNHKHCLKSAKVCENMCSNMRECCTYFSSVHYVRMYVFLQFLLMPVKPSRLVPN